MPIKKFNVSSITPGSITGAAIEPTVLTSITPKITGIAVANNAYSVLDDTAVDVGGGYIVITGTGFAAGCSVLIGSLVATSVSFVNSTTVRAQVPAQAAGTYTVYLTNTDGGVAIRINGLNYSSTPTWSTTSPLTSGSVDIPISVQLSASSNSTVSYAVQAGSTLPPGLTLSNVGVLSGTITGISVETTYNFTIEATDLELQNTPRAFSITITVNDQYFEYVTSLLSASTPASTFASDASTNGFNVTVNGDTRPTNFGPYTPGYYSNYFSGSTRLTAPSGAKFAYGTGTFTIEAWVYPLTYQAGSYPGSVIYSQAEYGQNYLMLTIGGSGEAAFTYGSGGGSGISTAAGLVPLNAWTHVAAVREGTGSNQFKIYVNGVAQVTSTLTFDFSNTTMSIGIGSYPHDNSSLPLRGYISNLRITRGTALYTSNFTPSATPLTASASTSLLTCQSNRFIDESSSPSTITVNGAVEISPFDPFVPSTSFAGRGSGYFDGTGDYLTVSSSMTAPGTGDFTIELWVYLTAASRANDQAIWESRAADLNATGFTFGIRTTNTIQVYSNARLIETSALAASQWYHLALVRSGTTMTVYVNGVSGGTATNSQNFSDISYKIGQGIWSPSDFGAGYISNLRYTRSAVYTTAFTPPTTPLTAIANTSLLTLQNNQPNNNSMFLDSSTNNFTITRNGNTTQGTFSPYGGGWSTLFSSGNYLSAASNAAFGFGTGDFTVEAWVFPNAAYTTYNYIWATGANGGLVLYVLGGVLYVRNYGNADILASSTAPALNTWSHVAATRSGTTLRIFVNGVQTGSTTNSTNFATGSALIGNDGTNVAPWLGYISNLRVVKGTALYTSNFTPSTTPLTPVAGTSLLACADNRFIDDSANGFALTVTGSPTVQRFNPFNPVTTTPTSYSAYFDGTGDYLAISNGGGSAFDMGTGNCTIEMWVYPDTQTTNFPSIFASSASWSAGTFYIRYSNTGAANKFGVYWNSVGDPFFTTTNTYPINVWYHVALVRNGTTFTLYINGVADGTGTSSASLNLAVGGSIWLGNNASASCEYKGLLSNVRVVKGTAVYTGNFTPPTTPLTAIANTSLLTCQSATFVDASTNAFAITATGDAAPRQFNPFGWTSTSTAYTPTVYGGSAYFDGTGDFLTAAHPGMSGNWTIEFWWYATSFATQQSIVSFNNGSLSGINIWCNTSAQLVVDDGVTGQSAFTSTAFRAGQWNHIAVVRNGSTTTGYINGILAGSHSFTPATVGFINIGRYNSSPFYYVTGYVSDVRTIIGQVLYTSNFAPPVAPLTARQNTVFLASMTGAGIYDSAMMVNYETVGNASINTALKKYGNTSIYFDGTGDYLTTASNPSLAPRTGDFTWETWVYFPSGSSYRQVFSNRTGAINSANMGSLAINPSNGLTWYTDGFIVNYTTSIGINQWVHIAVCRAGSTLRVFANGTSVGSATNSQNLTGSVLTIGANNDGSEAFNGWLDDIRITNGVARYTANFTPTASPFMTR